MTDTKCKCGVEVAIKCKCLDCWKKDFETAMSYEPCFFGYAGHIDFTPLDSWLQDRGWEWTQAKLFNGQEDMTHIVPITK